MSLAPCAVAAPADQAALVAAPADEAAPVAAPTDEAALAGAPADQAALVAALCDRIEELERRLAATVRGLRRAEADVALLNDRLAWAEADLAASVEIAGAPPPLRPSG